MRQHLRTRPAFTIIECVMALAVVGIMLVLVAQIATWSMLDRMRRANRQAALEHAANILEAARAVPVEKLAPDWAASQQGTPSAVLPQESRVAVIVTPEAAGTRRVSVTVSWRTHADAVEQSLQLVSVFGPRSGGEP